MTTRIIGFDPGLATLGFGIVECQTPAAGGGESPPSAIDFGAIQTRPGQSLGDRLETIYGDLHALLDQWQPDIVGVEKLFFYRMGNTISVAQARGVLLLVLAQRHLPLFEFTPAQVKQALTGYGNAKKYEVQEAVARELNLEAIPKPDDAADALAIALTTWFDRDRVSDSQSVY